MPTITRTNPDVQNLLGQGTPTALPTWVEPTNATLTHHYFWDAKWSYEEKLDGERILATKDKAVTLYSRNHIVLNPTYPEIVSALEKVPGQWRLDGELVAFSDGVTSFKTLQQRIGIKDPEQARMSGVNVYFYLFDVMYLDGYDVRNLRYEDRRCLLWSRVNPADPLRLVASQKPAQASFTAACKRGWEGLMVKNLDSRYESRRTTSWLKFKCSSSQELIIIGFTDPQGARTRFGALLLGYYRSGQLHYAGKVGTGFNQDTLDSLYTMMKPLETTRALVPEHISASGVHFIQPKLVAEIGFTEWTNDNKLRHPRYLGLRDDKSPTDVIKEEPV